LNWQTILKAPPITIGTTRIGMKPMPEDDDDTCFRELNRYVDKVKNAKLDVKVPDWFKDVNFEIATHNNNIVRYQHDHIGDDKVARDNIPNVHEDDQIIINFYKLAYIKPMDEKVACEILKLIKNYRNKQANYLKLLFADIKDDPDMEYEYILRFNVEQKDIAELVVFKWGIDVIFEIAFSIGHVGPIDDFSRQFVLNIDDIDYNWFEW